MRIADLYNRLIFFQATILFSAISLSAFSQSNNILDQYIREGISNNLALKQKELNLEKSLKALKEANGLFFPSVGLEAQYFLAKGGRSVDLPVGDMLNPVYTSLNQILQNSGQPGEFQQIENQEIQFLPNDYHDTKVRIILPLVNAEIYYNRKIKKEMINFATAEVNVYKRELVKEIKTAYIRYLQSKKVFEAYESALQLVNEALRVNTKLVENQMAGPEKIFRIEADQNHVKAQLTKAENDIKTATTYFNFLINQPLENNIVVDSTLWNINNTSPYTENISDLKIREEITLLNSAIKSSEYFFKLKKSWLIPSISNITDLGYQGYSYKFDNEQRYIMNTVNLSWPIFNGFQNRNKAMQARIEKEKIQHQLAETEYQIEMQARIANYNLIAAAKSEEANRRSMLSSEEYFKVITKQYGNGQKSLLELLDARNQLTNAQINHTVSHFDTCIRLAELERANAGFDLNSINQ